MFFLKCKKNNIPTPETILLSEDIELAKKQLKEFNRWPVVLKRIRGTCGEYVEKADNLIEAEKVIKKFWKKGAERIPIIAQEFFRSPSYRVTVIGDKIVQTAIKNNKGWKATGIYAKRIKRYPVDEELENLTKKIMKFVDIKVCGIDFLKNENGLLALEVNSAPGLDFFECEREKMVNEVIELLIKLTD
jgi:glutathione synthase/RimK-type ligase-like ATP-grasp enzyme